MLIYLLGSSFVFLFFAVFLIRSKSKKDKKNDYRTARVMKHDHRVAYLEPSLTPSNESQNAEASADPLVDSVVSDIETKESSDDILGLSVSPEVLDSKSEDASQHESEQRDELRDSAHPETDSVSLEESSYVDSENPSDEDTTLPEFIILYLRASEDKPYGGYELLQALLSNGLRYGKHNIFHQFDSNTARAKILFSLSSAIQPGTFDLPKMGGYSTPALSLFFKPEEVENPMKVFESMLNTAGQLSEDLGGKVLCADRELLTKEKVRDICLRIHRHEKHVSNLDLFIDA